jgi:hypothetical protein
MPNHPVGGDGPPGSRRRHSRRREGKIDSLARRDGSDDEDAELRVTQVRPRESSPHHSSE